MSIDRDSSRLSRPFPTQGRLPVVGPVRERSVAPLWALLTLAVVGSPGPLHAQADVAERERALQEEYATPRPIAAHNSVWIEELTWMEVRDAIAEGKTTAIVTTGGIEQNGPYVATGKHNFVLEGMCESIARSLDDALCAPIIRLVPEGGIAEPSGHMRYSGTISVRPETFQALLEDVAGSLRVHGFTDIVFLGDSGGNQRWMSMVADRLNAEWDDARIHFIPEFYNYAEVERYMEEDLGVVQTRDDGLHDNFYITSMMMTVDPTVVRYDQRVDAGLATINGVSLEPKAEAIEVGRKLVAYRTELTVEAIRASLAQR